MTEAALESSRELRSESILPSEGIEEDKQPGQLSRVMNSIKQIASVSELMRVFGAIVMVASMSLFLVQGWTEQNDVQRYLKLLTQTGLLATAGLLLSIFLKEYRGARMFFGLSLVSIPVNFTVIGALIFSAFNTGILTEGMPAFAHWTIAEGTSIGLVTLGAIAALLPITWFAFRVMARRSAGKLTVAFVLLNATLMFPVRDGLSLIAVFLITAVAGLATERFLKHRDNTLTTPGGVFSRILLFAPALLIFVRSAGFYTFDPVLNVIAAAGLYFMTRYFADNLGNNSAISVLLRCLQAISGFATALISTQFFADGGYSLISLVAMNVVLAIFMIDYRSVRPRFLAKSVIAMTTLLLAAGTILNVVFVPSLMGTAVAIATGIFLIGYGAAFKQRLFLIIGGLVIAAASFSAISNFTQLLMQSGWVGLGVLGGVAIVGASLLDRYGAAAKLYLTNLPVDKQ